MNMRTTHEERGDEEDFTTDAEVRPWDPEEESDADLREQVLSEIARLDERRAAGLPDDSIPLEEVMRETRELLRAMGCPEADIP